MSVLVPCPSCRRHIRASEPTCPFCTATTPSDLASRAIPGTPRRMKRAAVMAFASSIAIAGCSGTSSSETSVDTGFGSIDAAYGGPPDIGSPDAEKDDTGSPDTNVAPDAGGDTNTPSIDSAYGAPPDIGMDTGPDARPDTFDGGSAMPLYGLPPPDTGAK